MFSLEHKFVILYFYCLLDDVIYKTLLIVTFLCWKVVKQSLSLMGVVTSFKTSAYLKFFVKPLVLFTTPTAILI